MTTFHLTTLTKDSGIRQALARCLEGDKRLSQDDVRTILRGALDGDGVTPQEFADLKTILQNAKSLDEPSRQMIEAFLKRHYRAVIPGPRVPAGQLTANFNVSEFACKDGTAVPQNLRDNVQTLANNLQKLRDAVGKSIKINSGYRTAEHNKAIGGKADSQHLKAKAADIVVSGMAPTEVKKEIEALIKSGAMSEGGIGLYNSFVHYDIRGAKARW